MRTRFPSPARARSQLAALIGTYQDRPASYLVGVAAVVTRWGLASIDPATFGFLDFVRVAPDASITAAGVDLTEPSQPWSAADVGLAIQVAGAGPGGAVLSTTIAEWVDAGHVRLAVAASTTVSASATSAGGLVAWGGAITAGINRRPLQDDQRSYVALSGGGAAAPSPFPVGMIGYFDRTAAPDGWIACAGQSLDAVSDPSLLPLYVQLGTRHGGTGPRAFNAPPSQRFLVGAGGVPGLTAYTVGQVGGEEQHALTVNEMPAHHHQIALFDETGWGVTVADGDAIGASGTVNTGDTGGSAAHENRPPYLAMLMCLKK